MNYELAKQLKDAGFRQRTWKYAFHYHPTERNELGERMIYLYCDLDESALEGSVYIPPLSELIEACGKGFGGLFRHYDNDSLETVEWLAMNGLAYSNVTIEENGETPEKAVAKLWLELNK